MTHQLKATTTLDAGIHICAPPPPKGIHTVWRDHMHNTTSNIACQGWGGWVRGRSQAPHKHPLSVELSTAPPFHVVIWVVGLLCLLCLRLGRVSITFLQVCFCFLNWLKKCVHSDTKR